MFYFKAELTSFDDHFNVKSPTSAMSAWHNQQGPKQNPFSICIQSSIHMYSSTVLANNFSHRLVKLLIFLDDRDSVGASDVDFQSSEEENHDDDDEVAVGGEGDVHQEMDPSSEILSAANQSEPESGQHYAWKHNHTLIFQPIWS